MIFDLIELRGACRKIEASRNRSRARPERMTMNEKQGSTEGSSPSYGTMDDVRERLKTMNAANTASTGPSENFILDELFTYHAPDAEQQVHYDRIRRAARAFARAVLDHTPRGSDQSAVIRLIREAVMTANASVALRGLNF